MGVSCGVMMMTSYVAEKLRMSMVGESLEQRFSLCSAWPCSGAVILMELSPRRPIRDGLRRNDEGLELDLKRTQRRVPLYCLAIYLVDLISSGNKKLKLFCGY
jgi:hypothetical protein